MSSIVVNVCLAFFSFFILTNASPPIQISPYADQEDVNLTVRQLIVKNRYPVEEHKVITPDGYILTIHRIPNGRDGQPGPKKVAFVQHGLLSSSADWIIPGPGKSLGYILADAGYDVWLGNARGNTQSRNHTKLNPNKDGEFWDFSWHEIGYYDLPTMIDYVLEKTNQPNLYYIGHSQGTTVYYVMASMRPEYNAKIKMAITLAPVAFMDHMTAPLLRIIAFWQKPLAFLADLIGLHEFLPSNKFITMGGSLLCRANSISAAICHNAFFAFCGFSPDQLNATLVPIMLGHFPAGSASKQIIHYGQGVQSGRFGLYDHGLIGNKKKYGSFSAPDYDLNKVTAPTYLIYSRNDWLSSEIDVDRLYKRLGNARGRFLITENSFNHLDYIIGIDAPKYVYNKVLSLMVRH